MRYKWILFPIVYIGNYSKSLSIKSQINKYLVVHFKLLAHLMPVILVIICVFHRVAENQSERKDMLYLWFCSPYVPYGMYPHDRVIHEQHRWIFTAEDYVMAVISKIRHLGHTTDTCRSGNKSYKSEYITHTCR